MAPNLQFSLPSGSGGPPAIHKITPALLDGILEHPTSRYSRLASTVANTLHTLSIEGSTSSNTTTTISLPQRTDPAAFLVLLRFLEFGHDVYNPVTNELREKDGEGGTKIVLVARDAVRSVFALLTVEWPWETLSSALGGFGASSGGVVGFGSAYGTGFGSGDELSVGYVRPKEDYSSQEVYQAYREQVRDDLFGVMTISDSPPKENSGRGGGGGGGGGGGVGGSWGEKPSYNNRSDGLYGGGPSSSSSKPLPSDMASSAPPPSYESSNMSPPNNLNHPVKSEYHSNQPAHNLQQTLDNAILTLLSTLLERHIQPAIHQQVLHGMFNGTFILLPASPLTRKLKTTPSDDEIITSFAKRSEYRKIIHLGEQGAGAPGFLMQDVVIAMLKKGLGEALAGREGTEEKERRRREEEEEEREREYYEKMMLQQQQYPPPPATPQRPEKGKSGWFGGWKKAYNPPQPPPPPPQPMRMPWRRRKASPKPKKGSLVVDVQAVDIWIRRETELGLLETEQTKGVVVWVETVT